MFAAKLKLLPSYPGLVSSDLALWNRSSRLSPIRYRLFLDELTLAMLINYPLIPPIARQSDMNVARKDL